MGLDISHYHLRLRVLTQLWAFALVHPPLAVVGRTKILNIATMLAGFSDSISTPPCMFEKHLLVKF